MSMKDPVGQIRSFLVQMDKKSPTSVKKFLPAGRNVLRIAEIYRHELGVVINDLNEWISEHSSERAIS